jgi:hypothetical protein
MLNKRNTHIVNFASCDNVLFLYAYIHTNAVFVLEIYVKELQLKYGIWGLL